MKKILATASSNTLNWEYLPFLVAKVMNHTITPRTGFTPVEMVFGKSKLTESFLDLEPLFPLHHSIKSHKEDIENLNKEIIAMSETAKLNLESLRTEAHSRENKNRVDKSKNFKEGDIVFALDRYNIPGNSRPLKTTFLPSPYVVIDSYFTTTLIERIADKFRTLISNDDIKKYVPDLTENIINLPVEVKKILISPNENLLPEEITIITEKDTLRVPPGLTEGGESVHNQKYDKVFSVLKKGQAPVGPDDNFESQRDNFYDDDDDFDDWVTFKDNESDNGTLVPPPIIKPIDVQQDLSQELPHQEEGYEEISKIEETNEAEAHEEEEEEDEELTLRSGKRVRFAQ
jgi:hypothetical protein